MARSKYSRVQAAATRSRNRDARAGASRLESQVQEQIAQDDFDEMVNSGEWDRDMLEDVRQVKGFGKRLPQYIVKYGPSDLITVGWLFDHPEYWTRSTVQARIKHQRTKDLKDLHVFGARLRQDAIYLNQNLAQRRARVLNRSEKT